MGEMNELKAILAKKEEEMEEEVSHCNSANDIDEAGTIVD